jgi:glutaminyl-tRNA synthetase
MNKEFAIKEFQRVGIDETNTKNLMKNENKALGVLEVLNFSNSSEASTAGPLYITLASKAKTKKQKEFIAPYIGDNRISTSTQLDEALNYFTKTLLENQEPDVQFFEKVCGVGVVVTKEQVEDVVAQVLKSNATKLQELGWSINIGDIVQPVKKFGEMKWADGKLVKEEVDRQLLKLLGEKPSKIEKPKVVKKEKPTEDEEEGVSRKFEARDLEDAKNTQEQLEKHLKATGGKVVTRFPPEPNGFLHIGHAKAMNLSFNYAKDNSGITLLRFDDTNPDAESNLYYESIKEMVDWLGFKPHKTTSSADYFEELFNYAVQLINDDLAYVDPSNATEMAQQRKDKVDSPYRNRPKEESMKLFLDMKKGKYEEGSMALRGKMYNANLRDPVFYRIKYKHHVVSGDKWCVYPSYDFTHCIVDSIENVTHSLCTLEFETRRESYYWLLKNLNLYKPHVWEFSKLQLTKTVLSKRNILKMVNNKIVRGWDDPRLLTLAGLRRRGYTPESIKSFCHDIGVTRVNNTIPLERLEQSCRVDLDDKADRVFVILNPLKITITNYDKFEKIDASNHPKDPTRGTRKLPFSNVLYIEKNDFRMVDSKDYYGLAPNKEVGLRYSYNITCTDVIKDSDDNVIELKAIVDLEKKNKPKTHIHWLARDENNKDPMVAEVRIYKPLFTVEDPSAEANWETVVDTTSEEIIKDAFIDPIFADAKKLKIFSHYQFERLGFFTVDSDTTENSIVFNRTVTLKESFQKFSK